MSEPSNKVLAALGAGSPEKKGGENTDLTSELEKANHKADVWAGRAKSLSDENAELKRKLAEAEARSRAERVAEAIPADVKKDIPDDYLKASITGTQHVVDEAMAGIKKENDDLRKQMKEQNDRSFMNEIGMRHGSFFEEVGAGGSKEQLWNQFRDQNKETFKAIMDSHDTTRFASFVEQFYTRIGSPNPSGVRGGAAAPEPGKAIGGAPTVTQDDQGKQYTQQEYLTELERAEEARNAGDMATYRAVTQKLTKALNEGRVK